MSTPAWLAAVAGNVQAVNAGQINQFLGTHKVNFAYAGTSQVFNTNTATSSQASNSLWLAQPFTTANPQTRLERFVISAAIFGSPTSAWQVGIMSDNAGSPSGTWLSWVYVPAGFLTTTARWLSIPAGLTVTSSTKYHIVAAPEGDANNHFLLQTTGTAGGQVAGLTSANGTTWNSLSTAYFLFNTYAGTGGLLTNIAEDGPLPYTRWEELIWSAGNQLSTLNEAVNGTSASTVFDSERTMTYTNGVLTSVA